MVWCIRAPVLLGSLLSYSSSFSPLFESLYFLYSSSDQIALSAKDRFAPLLSFSSPSSLSWFYPGTSHLSLSQFLQPFRVSSSIFYSALSPTWFPQIMRTILPCTIASIPTISPPGSPPLHSLHFLSRVTITAIAAFLQRHCHYWCLPLSYY